MTEFFWHIHHTILVEPLTEPLENRVEYIKAEKPKWEVETRLRLMQPVKGRLPETYVKAWEAYVKAWEAYNKAREAYDKAREACMPEIEALHSAECLNCPWNGETIFP